MRVLTAKLNTGICSFRKEGVAYCCLVMPEGVAYCCLVMPEAVAYCCLVMPEDRGHGTATCSLHCPASLHADPTHLSPTPAHHSWRWSPAMPHPYLLR